VRPYPAVGGTPTGSKFLRDDLQWATPAGGGSPGGSDTQIQYNNAGAFAGSTGMTWNESTQTFTVCVDRFIVDNTNNTFQVYVTDGTSFPAILLDAGVGSAGLSSPNGQCVIGDYNLAANGTLFIVDDAAQKTTSNVKHYPDLDAVWTDNTAGPVIKDTSNGHWYRIKVTAGVLGVTDLGTSLP